MKTLNERQKANRVANRVVKIGGALQLLLALVGLSFIDPYGWPIASMMIAGGLFMLLFAPEMIDDERVKQLKLKAITWGYASGLLAAVFYNFGSTYPQLKHLPALSIFDGFIIVTAIALGLFHYWRWQDGRAAAREDSGK